MDRRTFLGAVSTAGIAATVATGVAVRESSATQARASGLARAAGAASRARPASSAATTGNALVADGVILGYLPGSAGMFATPAVERLMRANAKGLRWARWDVSSATQANQSAIHSLFKISSFVDLSIGVLHKADRTAGSVLRGLDIVAHFALSDAPYFAPFDAWHYEAAGASTPAKSTQPLTFSGRVPDFLSLQVNYAINPAAVATGIGSAGMLYLPIGPNAASGAGLATGLYILAAPSAYTGVQPDMSAYVFSGDVHAPIADPSGRALDFDYLTLAIRPVAV